MTHRYARTPPSRPRAPGAWAIWPLPWWLTGSAVVALLVVGTFLSYQGSWLVGLLVPFAGVSVVIAAIDIRWRVIPNRLVLPAAVGAIALAFLTGLADADPARALGAVLGSAALFVVYLVPALIVPSAMGFGDVKLALLVGAVLGALGVQAWVAGALAGFVVGAVIGLVGLATRRVTLRSRLPFAPAMLAGAWLVILLAPLGK